MPDRYHVHTTVTPGRFYRVGKYGGVDWREDCARCKECVKPLCNYDVHENETGHNRDPLKATQPLYECKACFSCVQGCTKGLLSLSVNPEFLDMGDEYWKPDMIHSTWVQADMGKIPVSGAGYRGPFNGPGFDSIWTDMSEIVRPTRDGIHGREYISTAVDIGSKPMRLSFSPDGKMITPPSNLLEIPIPIILDIPAWPVQKIGVSLARAAAARDLQTVAVMFSDDAEKVPPSELPYVCPILTGEDIQTKKYLIQKCNPMIQLRDRPDLSKIAAKLLEIKPDVICSIRLTLRPETADRIIELSQKGFKVFHLCADQHGCEKTKNGTGRHIRDAVRAIHDLLVKEGMRDEITLITSGGIALAEHMAKAIICGSDLVAADTVLLVSLGCRVCLDAHPLLIHGADPKSSETCRIDCPVGSAVGDIVYASRRMVNLMGAWHSQLIEVLGAMGIREVRRLRGEVGRAIFMEEIEEEAFSELQRVPKNKVCA